MSNNINNTARSISNKLSYYRKRINDNPQSAHIYQERMDKLLAERQVLKLVKKNQTSVQQPSQPIAQASIAHTTMTSQVTRASQSTSTTLQNKHASASIQRTITEDVHGFKTTTEYEIRQEASKSITTTNTMTIENIVTQQQTLISNIYKELENSSTPPSHTLVKKHSTAFKRYGKDVLQGYLDGQQQLKQLIKKIAKKHPNLSENAQRLRAMAQFVHSKKLDGNERFLTCLTLYDILSTPIPVQNRGTVYDGFQEEDVAEIICYKVALLIEMDNELPSNLQQEMADDDFPYLHHVGKPPDTYVFALKTWSNMYGLHVDVDFKDKEELYIVIGQTHPCDALFLRVLPNKQTQLRVRAIMRQFASVPLNKLERAQECAQTVQESSKMVMPTRLQNHVHAQYFVERFKKSQMKLYNQLIKQPDNSRAIETHRLHVEELQCMVNEIV